MAPVTAEVDDPGYVRSWADLRRREVMFWLVVLSYVPGLWLVIIIINMVRSDLPEHMLTYLSVLWLAAYVLVVRYRKNFRCPRCHHLFFRRGIDTDEQHCMSCGLPRCAPNASASGAGDITISGKNVVTGTQR